MNTQNDLRLGGRSIKREKKTRLLNLHSQQDANKKKVMCLMLRGKNLGTSDIWEGANQ